jgi:hypothetical protein
MVKWKQAVGVVVVSLAIVAGTMSVASAAPARDAREPDHRPCVTQGEYYSVHQGYRRARVFRVFDSRGRVLEQRPRFEKRRWWICDVGPGSPVRVKFRLRHGTWRLTHKYAAAG